MGDLSTVEDPNWGELITQKQKGLEEQIPSDWRLSKEFIAQLPKNGRLLEADIPRRSGILSEEEIDITENYSATELLQKLAEEKLTSYAVTQAFCKRAAIAQQLVRKVLRGEGLHL